MEEKILEFSQSKVKQEPPVEFVLTLPRPTSNWPHNWHLIKEENVQRKWMKSVELMKFDSKWRRKSTPFQTFFTCPHCQLIVKNQIDLTRHLRYCNKINSARLECDSCRNKFRKKGLIRLHVLKHLSEGNFRCNECGHGFKSRRGLLIHSRSKNTHKCKTCAITFSCALLLNRHRSEFHRKMLECDKCSYRTRRKGYLINHIGTHNKSIACDTCQRKFATNHSLKFHQTTQRHGIYAVTPAEAFVCDECGKSSSSPHYLKMHRKQVHDEEKVKCEVCGKIYKNRFSLRLHSRSHVKDECSICHKMVTKLSMALHVRMHSAGSLFKCDLCEFSTKTKQHLKRHIERMHLLVKLVDDSRCRDDFCDFELLDKLQLKHGSFAAICEKNFKCDKCCKFFVTSKLLKEHNKSVHSEDTFECEICKKTFKTKKHLRAHNGHVHLKVSCSICNKKVGKYQMKSHMKLHQNGKRLECDRCGFKAEFKNHLKKHINNKHSKGALTCNLGCKKMFASFHQLFHHQKMHIGKKQFKCLACDYQATCERDLFNHMSARKH